MKHLRPAIVLTILFILITGAAYPGVITAVSQLLFPRQANGSLVEVNGQVIGSELIAQPFTQPYYFHPRPSPNGYNAAASAANNKGPTDRKLADTLIAGAVAQARAETGATGNLPSDMVTGSGSALDPHISPANAALQIARVANARGVSEDRVRALVAEHTEGRVFSFFGEPRINVLLLNLALDREFPRAAAPRPGAGAIR